MRIGWIFMYDIAYTIVIIFHEHYSIMKMIEVVCFATINGLYFSFLQKMAR